MVGWDTLGFLCKEKTSHSLQREALGRAWGRGELAAGSPKPVRAFALTLETVSSAVWLTTCSAVALKLSTLINHPRFK